MRNSGATRTKRIDLAAMRKEYTRHGLRESDVRRDPFAQFQAWFKQACAAGVPEPNAMSLATATRSGRVFARMVLLKGADQRGFSFFTNYASAKAKQLADNSRAALVFFWPELERQVRIEGRVTRVSVAESDEYFRQRPWAA